MPLLVTMAASFSPVRSPGGPAIPPPPPRPPRPPGPEGTPGAPAAGLRSSGFSTKTFTCLMVRSGRSPRLTPTACAAARPGSASTIAPRAGAATAASRKSRRDPLFPDITILLSHTKCHYTATQDAGPVLVAPAVFAAGLFQFGQPHRRQDRRRYAFNQNISFNPNCICLEGTRVELMIPSLATPTVAPGWPKIGWLARLNISPRKSTCTRSLMENDLNIEALITDNPGPTTLFRPELPYR